MRLHSDSHEQLCAYVCEIHRVLECFCQTAPAQTEEKHHSTGNTQLTVRTVVPVLLSLHGFLHLVGDESLVLDWSRVLWRRTSLVQTRAL